jgi:hypothetical protein
MNPIDNFKIFLMKLAVNITSLKIIKEKEIGW